MMNDELGGGRGGVRRVEGGGEREGCGMREVGGVGWMQAWLWL